MAKQHKLEMTPIMSLSMMVLFLMMLPIFGLVQRNQQVREYNAQVLNEETEVVTSPSPSPSPSTKMKGY